MYKCYGNLKEKKINYLCSGTVGKSGEDLGNT